MGKAITKHGPTKPPLLIVECPHGHLWADLNPVWVVNGSNRTKQWRARRWCPAHRDEFDRTRAEAMRRALAEKVARYDEMPLPETKKCNDCNQVKPAWAFYTRKSKRRKDGTQTLQLYAYCKVCTKKKNAAAWDALPIDEKRKRRARYDSTEASRQRKLAYKQREREKNRRQNIHVTESPLVPSAPFVEWWFSLNGKRPNEIQMGGSLTRRVREIVSGRQDKVRLLHVEQLGVLADDYELTARLYPEAPV